MTNASTPVIYLLLIAVGIAGAAGDILVSRWARSNVTTWLLASWVCWIASVTLFGYLMRTERFAFSAAIFVAFAAHGVTSVLFEQLVLRQRLSREEWLGIALATIAVVMLEVGRVRREAATADTSPAIAIALSSRSTCP